MISSKINNILAKKNREKLVCLTAYTYPVAKAIDEFCDVVLVGDSLGMAIYGFKDTVDVTLGMMIDHGAAVVRGCLHSLVVVDIPAKTFEESSNQALQTALEIVEKTGCDAVKIETGADQIDAIRLMVANGVNVMGHVGLLPQQVRELGGYKYQGRDADSAARIVDLALATQDAGAFSIVVEAVPAWLADEISARLKIPVIGIGASKNCDGQILVIDDLLGLNQEFTPRFVKKYENLAQKIKNAAKNFQIEVKSGIFPEDSNLLEK